MKLHKLRLVFRTILRLAAGGLVFLQAAGVVAEQASSLASRPDEPLRATFSVARAAEGLDAIPRDWKETTCVACHLQHSYLMARPAISTNAALYQEMLRSLEQTAAKCLGPTPSKQDVTAVVLTAVALARQDACSQGKLRPVTRQTLGIGRCRARVSRPATFISA
jgi:hypothetical protein